MQPEEGSENTYAIDIESVEEEKCERVSVKGCEFGLKVYDGIYFTNACRNMSSVRNFKLHSDDLIVCSFAKSGTTWTQAIVCLIKNNCNWQNFDTVDLSTKYIFIDEGIPENFGELNKPPRFIKSHLPVSFMPNNLAEAKPKIIYVVRNPKDSLVSLYNFMKHLKKDRFIGTFKDMYELFSKGKFIYGPWWDHVNSYTTLPNCLIVHYEDLIEKPIESIKKIANFLDKTITDEQAGKIAEYTKFENLKKKKDTMIGIMSKLYFDDKMQFFRKGQIGDWRNYFTDEMSAEFDAIIAQNLKYNKPFNYGNP